MPHNPINDLTARFVRSIISYNKKTGVLRWKYKKDHLAAKRVAGIKHHTGYLYVKIKGRMYGAHRIAWLIVKGRWPRKFLDHKNGIKNDNRFTNLRNVTHFQNGMNRRKIKAGSSKLKGVSLSKTTGLWHTTIMKNGRSYYLGQFKTDVEGHAVYCNAAIKLHGNFRNYGHA